MGREREELYSSLWGPHCLKVRFFSVSCDHSSYVLTLVGSKFMYHLTGTVGNRTRFAPGELSGASFMFMDRI